MQPGSNNSPSGAGPDPDQDKYNPANKRWEAPRPAEEVSEDDVNTGNDQDESSAKDPVNATKRQQSAAEAEKKAGGSSSSDSASLPGENFDYNPTKNKKKSGRLSLSRKQKMSVGAAGFVGGGLLFAAIPLLAPLKLLQFGNLLRGTHFFSGEDFGEDRSGKMFRRYMRRGSIQGTRLGAVGNKVAVSWEKRLVDNSGVRMLYDTSGNLAGIEIFDENKARSSGALDGINELDGISEETGNTNRLNAGSSGDPVDPSKRRFTSSNSSFFDDVFQRRNNKLTKTLVKSAGHGKISSFVGTRVLKKLGAVNFHPIDRLQRRAVSSGVDRWLDYKQARAEKHSSDLKTGVDPPNIANADGTTDTDADGNDRTRTIDGVDSDDFANETNNLKSDIQKPDADIAKIKSNVLKNVRRGTGVAAVIAVMCAVKNFGDGAIAQKVSDTLEVAQRIGFEHIAIASQLITLEDLSLEEIRYFWEIMEDEKGYDMFASVTAQGAMGKTADNMTYENPEINANLVINAYEKPLIFDILDKVPLLGTACAVSGGIGDFISGIPVLGKAFDLIGEVQEKVISTGVKVVSGYNMEEVIGMAIEAVNGAGLDPLAEGIERGNIAMYGSLLAANTNEYAKGARTLSQPELTQLEEYQAIAEREERMEKSLFARLFDIQDTKSVVAQAIIDSPNSHEDAAYALLDSVSPVSFVSNVSDSFTAKASAATNTFDYGVPKFGFSLDEKNNPLIEDPFENAEEVEADFDRLNGLYGDCFPSKFDASGTLQVPTLNENPVNQFTLSDECKDLMEGDNDDFLQFRAYLYDTMSMTSLACFEGDGEACTTIGATSDPISLSGAQGSGTTGQTISDFDGPVIPCQGSETRREQVFINEGNNVLNWTTVQPTGLLDADEDKVRFPDIPVYVRDACAGQTNVRTIVVASGVHGLENGGQRVAWELLFNTNLPPDVRVIAIPEISPWAVANSSRTNANGVNLNRNFDYGWGTKSRDDPNPGSGNYRGPSAASEPETQAIQTFLASLGRTSFMGSYHSNLNYIASSGPNQHSNSDIEQRYFEIANAYNIQNRNGVNWKTSNESGTGFVEGWYNNETGSPSFLVELTDSARTTTDYTIGHAETIRQLLEEGVIN